MELEHKILPLDISEMKAVGDGWFVAGMASTFMGAPDSYGDVVAKGAFAESLKARPNVPLLWQHQQDEPIGKTVSLSENDQGLFGHWTLVPTPTGRKAHQLLDAELVAGLSIGFVTKEFEYTQDDVRVLKVVDLYEVSLVTIPANAAAVVTSFKTAVPFTTLLEQAGEVLRATVREAKALRDRRVATNRARPLNDQHTQAIGDFTAEAEALLAELSALVVVEPEAKAPDFGEIGLQLAERRMRQAARFKESAA